MANIGLGRGLSSLFTDTEEAYRQAQSISEGEVVSLLPVAQLYANPDQPRKAFDQAALKELSLSIAENGVIVPLIVNRVADDRYMIIAGERRYRAAKMAGLDVVPAIVKSYSPAKVEEIALIENLQREDLNPMEEAAAMRRLLDEYSMTQEELSAKIGKSRSAIANTMRLLTLPQNVQKMVEEGQLSAGHARALLTLPQRKQEELAKLIVVNGYSVRKAEEMAKNVQAPVHTKSSLPKPVPSVEMKKLENKLRQTFGTKVQINGSENKGKIVLEYYSEEDLNRIAERLDQLK